MRSCGGDRSYCTAGSGPADLWESPGALTDVMEPIGEANTPAAFTHTADQSSEDGCSFVFFLHLFFNWSALSLTCTDFTSFFTSFCSTLFTWHSMSLQTLPILHYCSISWRKASKLKEEFNILENVLLFSSSFLLLLERWRRGLLPL